MADSTYTVQKRHWDTCIWEDIGSKTVPAKTRRDTVLTAVLRACEYVPLETDRFRVLDADAARERSVLPDEDHKPKWRVV